MKSVGWDQFQELCVDLGVVPSSPAHLLKVGKLGTSKELEFALPWPLGSHPPAWAHQVGRVDPAKLPKVLRWQAKLLVGMGSLGGTVRFLRLPLPVSLPGTPCPRLVSPRLSPDLFHLLGKRQGQACLAPDRTRLPASRREWNGSLRALATVLSPNSCLRLCGGSLPSCKQGTFTTQVGTTTGVSVTFLDRLFRYCPLSERKLPLFSQPSCHGRLRPTILRMPPCFHSWQHDGAQPGESEQRPILGNVYLSLLEGRGTLFLENKMCFSGSVPSGGYKSSLFLKKKNCTDTIHYWGEGHRSRFQHLRLCGLQHRSVGCCCFFKVWPL